MVFDDITNLGLSPNQLYVLYCIAKDTEARHVNIHLEIRTLKTLNLLDDDSSITSKGLDIIKKFDSSAVTKPKAKKDIPVEEDMVKKYREIWPNCKIPTSGKYARTDLNNLRNAFKWFLNTYPYSWDTILKATEMYVEEHEAKGYAYMRTSQYFIKKSDSDKSINSDLANYCSLIESGINDTKPFVFKEKIFGEDDQDQ